LRQQYHLNRTNEAEGERKRGEGEKKRRERSGSLFDGVTEGERRREKKEQDGRLRVIHYDRPFWGGRCNWW